MADFGINPNIALGFQAPKTQSIGDLVGTAKGIMEFNKLSELYPAIIEQTKAQSRGAIATASSQELANKSTMAGKIASGQVSMYWHPLVQKASAGKLNPEEHTQLINEVVGNAKRISDNLGIPWEAKEGPSGKSLASEYVQVATNNPGQLKDFYGQKVLSLLAPSEQVAALHGEMVTGPDGQPAIFNRTTGTLSPVRYGRGGNVPPAGQTALGVPPASGSVPTPGGVTAADMTRRPGSAPPAAQVSQVGPGGLPVSQALPALRFGVRTPGAVAPILPEEVAAREGGQKWYSTQMASREDLLPARRDVQNVLTAANTLDEGVIPSTGPWAKLKKTVAELKGDDEYQFLNKSLAGLAARTSAALGGASANTQGGQALVQASVGTEIYSPKVLKKIAQNLDADFTHLDLRGAAADQFVSKYGPANVDTFRTAWTNHANPMVFKAMNVYRDAPTPEKAAQIISQMMEAEGVSEKQRKKFVADYRAINDMAAGKVWPLSPQKVTNMSDLFEQMLLGTYGKPKAAPTRDASGSIKIDITTTGEPGLSEQEKFERMLLGTYGAPKEATTYAAPAPSASEMAVLQAAVPQLDASGQVVRPEPTPTRKIGGIKGFFEPVLGMGEAALTLGTGAVAAPLAAWQQVATDVARGTKLSDDVFKRQMQNVYQPKTEFGKELVQDIGKAFEATKLPPVLTPEFMQLQAARAPIPEKFTPDRSAKGVQIAGVNVPFTGNVPTGKMIGAVEDVVRRQGFEPKPRYSAQEVAELQQIIRGQPAAAPGAAPVSAPGAPAPQARAVGPQSAGAAAVDVETQRIQRAQELPFPIVLEKSQATRDPADVRFARETAKSPQFGGPLQERYAEQNALLQKNMDYFAEQTGSQRLGYPEADFGKDLVALVDTNKKARRAEVNAAYDLAREAGETAELVPTSSLNAWVKQNRSSAKNAPVISTIEGEIKRLSKDGQISLNDLEEIRKTINDVRDASPTNARFGKRAINVIDKMTEGKGGDLYKNARSLNTAFKTEFEDTPVVSKITAMKRGTTQRQVPLENLVETVMLKGTGEDVRQLFSTLERMGPDGQAMINDLRGYVAEQIKAQSTKNVQLDINGKRYISTPELDKIIGNLDKSKKLELLFGKKGAEQYRTINDVVKDIQTVPRDTTNTSGTAATLLSAASEIGGQYMLTGVPLPVITVGKKLYDYRQDKKKMTKIRDFLNYGQQKD